MDEENKTMENIQNVRITPEMKRAGARILEDAFDANHFGAQETAEELFMAMWAARPS